MALFHAEVEAAGFDLTPMQYAALAAVEEHPGVDQITLAGMIAHDRTTIAGVIDRLARKELVVREVSPTDRRARTLSITETGSDVMRRIEPAVRATQQKLLGGLDAAEGEQLVALMRKAIDALNAQSRAPLKAREAE